MKNVKQCEKQCKKANKIVKEKFENAEDIIMKIHKIVYRRWIIDIVMGR